MLKIISNLCEKLTDFSNLKFVATHPLEIVQVENPRGVSKVLSCINNVTGLSTCTISKGFFTTDFKYVKTVNF